jgi:prenyltransferase beta subunit
MLQVARLAPAVLGDASGLVADFLRGQVNADGGFKDRDGRSDLYYTIFVIAALEALQAEWPRERVEAYLRGLGHGEELDFVHLGALARCWAAVGLERAPAGFAERLLARIEAFRAEDGGYDSEPGAAFGNAYGCFVALGAYQDLKAQLPEPLRMVQCLKFLETPDGGWGNARGLKTGATPATAAAITLLRQLDLPVTNAPAEWILAQLHPEGGFLAVPQAPLPDLLSTATALHALATMGIQVSPRVQERCLDFMDTLWSAEGGFHGHWADDHLDAEYTFYGLLALGHLSA